MVDDIDFAVDLKFLPPKIPEGLYKAVFVRAETAVVFKCPKIFLYFRIVQMGSFYETELYRPYRVYAIAGKGRSTKFTLKPRSELLRMLRRISGSPVRRDRASLSVLRGKVLQIQVRTVTKDYRQRVLPDFDQYSVIEDVICDQAEQIVDSKHLKPNSTHLHKTPKPVEK